MSIPKIKLEFNPDTMRVSDVKHAVQTLRIILQAYRAKPEDTERLRDFVSQFNDGYEV